MSRSYDTTYDTLNAYSPYGTGAPTWDTATGNAFVNPIDTATANAPVSGTDSWNSGGMDLRTITGGIKPPTVDGGLGSGGITGWFGKNADSLDIIFKGLGTIANIWSAWEANKIAKKQLDYMKQNANINIANMVKTLNTQYTDVAYNRDRSGGWTSEQANTWLNNAKLPNTRIS